ncbi:MAG: TetR/AcrR family transcriptional regulator [Pseudonocardiaceae bacterium]
MADKPPSTADPAQGSPSHPLRPGSADKRAAIERAALALFLRDGFARTSVDAVAAAAAVSKRTVYDYYGDKSRLFLDVLDRALAGNRARFAELLDRTLGGEVNDLTELEAALLSFGREFASATGQSQDRAAMIQLIVTEAPHFPALLEMWLTPGPEQVTLAQRLIAFADRGLLELPDPLQAAAHLGILVTTEVNNRTLHGALPIAQDTLEQIVASGVRVFLRAYQAPPWSPRPRAVRAARVKRAP